jgi:hypothetical protein
VISVQELIDDVGSRDSEVPKSLKVGLKVGLKIGSKRVAMDHFLSGAGEHAASDQRARAPLPSRAGQTGD